MATPGTQFDLAGVRARVLETIRALLEQLGSQGALPLLSATSQLDKDLGLGSLERVELLGRLEKEFAVRLPDRVAAEASTPEDFARALLSAPGSEDAGEEVSALRASAAAIPTQADANIFKAETLLDVLRFRATYDSGRTHLLITEDSAEGERSVTLTFGELYAAANRFAEELARHGVPAGGRVALMLPTSRSFFVSFAGILLAGAVPVPIYPPFRADRIEEYASRQAAILRNAGVCLLLTFHRAEAVAKLLKPRVSSLKAVADAEKMIEAADKPVVAAPGVKPPHVTGSRSRRAGDVALLQYTSGSTGNPKGVVLTHANLLANIRAVGSAVELNPADVGISWLPLYHDMGLIGAWLTLLHFGVPLVAMSPLAFLARPERWLQAFHKHGGTISAAPNFAYELCVRKIPEQEIAGLDLSSWRAALNGAEPVNPETLERFAQRFAACGFRREAQLPVYGLAEATLAVTVPPLNRGPWIDRVMREPFSAHGKALAAADDDDTAIAFVSSGKPLSRHEVRIVDGEGHELGERTEGFLWFRGPSVTSGYYGNAEATRLLLPLGDASGENEFAWVNSGDRAYRAGGEIFVTGRVKDIIIKGGRNLYPHEVEELASRAEGVRKGCVVAFGLKDEASGTEKLVVVAEARDRDASRRSAIAAAITEQVTRGLGLPPDRLEVIPPGSIPKTSSGKLRRDETRQLFAAGTLSAAKPPVWLQIAKLGTSSAVRTAGKSSLSLLKRAWEILRGVYFVAVFAVWIVPTWLMVLCIKDEKKAGRFTSAALKVLFAVNGCKVSVNGREYMRAPGAKIYASNHTSYFDVLPLMLGLGVPYRFVAKLEVTRMPFIGTFLKKMGHLWFDRTDPGSRLRQVEQMEDLLRKGDSMFVFPEGTFTAEDGIRPFQLGAFKSAVQTGVPVVPVSIAGSRNFLRDETYLPRPRNITITLSPPIYPANAKSGGRTGESQEWREVIRLRDATRDAIAAHAGEPVL